MAKAKSRSTRTCRCCFVRTCLDADQFSRIPPNTTPRTKRRREVEPDVPENSVECPNLVDDVFGAIVSPFDAAIILHQLLNMGLVTVHDGQRQLGPGHWVQACLTATHATVGYNREYSEVTWQGKNYLRQSTSLSWTLSCNLDVNRLNDLAQPAFAAAYVAGLFADHESPSIRNRFFSNPPKHPLPLLAPATQFCPDPSPSMPNISILPVDRAVVSSNERDQSRISDYLPLPRTNRIPERPLEKPGPRPSSLEELRVRLDAALPTESMPHGRDHESENKMLDTSWLNWPSLVAVGDMRESPFPSRKAALHADEEDSNCGSPIEHGMRHMRCSQPWRRFILGFTIAGEEGNTKVSLLRCDPCGMQHYTFELHSSSGILNFIRVVLGFAIADPQTLGHIPGMTVRPALIDARTILPDKPSPLSPLQYRYWEVDTITLPDSHNHATLEGTTFHVHHLQYDSGSLSGRCTRLFCVSKLLNEEEKHAFQLEHKADALDLGSQAVYESYFALKLRWMDTESELPSLDLANAAKARGVDPDLVMFPSRQVYSLTM